MTKQQTIPLSCAVCGKYTLLDGSMRCQHGDNYRACELEPHLTGQFYRRPLDTKKAEQREVQGISGTSDE